MGRRHLWNKIGTDFGVRRWLSLDPCGFMGLSLSFGVHIYALVVIATHLLNHNIVPQVLYALVYLPCAFLALASLWMAWTTDPGAVPLGARPLVMVRRASSAPRALRRCAKCHDNYKPPRAHHDSVTGRCVVKMDHFCPWVGNVVGALNHKYFVLFIFYTALCCGLTLLFLLLQAVQCGFIVEEENDEVPSGGQQQQHQQRILLSPNQTYLYPEACNRFFGSHWILGLLLASIVFLVFTCSMGCEQLEAISTGQGKIARLQAQSGRRNNNEGGGDFTTISSHEFNELFGGDSPNVELHWFWPFRKVEFPRGMRKVVLGYEWDPAWPAEAYQESDELQDVERGQQEEVVPLEETATPDKAFPQREGLVHERSDLSLTDTNSIKNRKNGSTIV